MAPGSRPCDSNFTSSCHPGCARKLNQGRGPALLLRAPRQSFADSKCAFRKGSQSSCLPTLNPYSPAHPVPTFKRLLKVQLPPTPILRKTSDPVSVRKPAHTDFPVCTELATGKSPAETSVISQVSSVPLQVWMRTEKHSAMEWSATISCLR